MLEKEIKENDVNVSVVSISLKDENKNEEKCIDQIKFCKHALDKNGEIGKDGFNYKDQLEFAISFYEVVLNKPFDRKLLDEF